MPIVLEVSAVVLAHAIGAWLITYLLHSTVLILLASGIERLHDRPSLHAVAWRTAILAPLVTASLHTALPFGSPFRVSTEPAGAVLGPRPLLALLVITCWYALIIVRLAVFVRTEVRARAALGSRHRASDADDVRTVTRYARALAMPRAPVLTISDRTFSPAALAPLEVCIPDRIFRELALAERNALLAHEVAHHARRDPLWCGAAAAVAAVCFFQPLNRRALRRLRCATEHAADEQAVRLTDDPLALARALASLAPHALRSARLRTAATGSPLVDRIRRILEGRTSPRASRALTAAQVAVFVGVCLAIGPGVNFTADNAANSIPSLTPSRAAPTVEMIEMRHVDRRVRATTRTLQRRVTDVLRP